MISDIIRGNDLFELFTAATLEDDKDDVEDEDDESRVEDGLRTEEARLRLKVLHETHQAQRFVET